MRTFALRLTQWGVVTALASGTGCTQSRNQEIEGHAFTKNMGQDLLVFDLREDSAPQVALLSRFESEKASSSQAIYSISLPVVASETPSYNPALLTTGSNWSSNFSIFRFQKGKNVGTGYDKVVSFATNLTRGDPRQNESLKCPCIYSNDSERIFFYPKNADAPPPIEKWPTPTAIGLVRPPGSTGMEVQVGILEIPKATWHQEGLAVYRIDDIQKGEHVTVRYRLSETEGQKRLGLMIISVIAALIPPLATTQIRRRTRSRARRFVEGTLVCLVSLFLIWVVFWIAGYVTNSEVGDKLVDAIPGAISTLAATILVDLRKPTSSQNSSMLLIGRKPNGN